MGKHTTPFEKQAFLVLEVKIEPYTGCHEQCSSFRGEWLDILFVGKRKEQV